MFGKKKICILDTNSLLFSFKLDVRPERAIDKIIRRFNLAIPEKILEEYTSKAKKGLLKEYDNIKQDIDLFFRRMKSEGRIFETRNYFHCLKYTERWFNLMGKQEEYKNKIDEGEKHCIALGLFLSRKNEKCLYIVTDDFDAVDAGIRLFVERQKIGLVFSLPELMTMNYLIDRGVLELNIKSFISDYFNLNKMRSDKFSNLKTELFEEIDYSCKKQFYHNCNICCRF